jgi:hypothetical protein
VEEAAASCGVSRDFFERHVLPELKVVQRGRINLIPVNKLEAWLENNARQIIRDGEFG